MTDIEAISKRDRDWHDPRFARPTKAHFWEFEAATDRHTLLAEIDRLTALNFTHNDEEHDCGTATERARILAAVEALYEPLPEDLDADGETLWFRFPSHDAVIAAIKGETT